MNFLRGIVRAQGQIFLQAGWGPAVFALAAMTVASAWFALAALAGAAVQAGCALALAGWDDARGLHRLREGGTRARSGIPGHDPESSRVGARALARSRAGVIPAEVDQGLHGFNGALTGCAAVLACGPGIPAALWTLAGSAVCALIVWGAPSSRGPNPFRCSRGRSAWSTALRWPLRSRSNGPREPWCPWAPPCTTYSPGPCGERTR
ncbi:urea transporter [Kocuria sp. PD6]|uniref:urea transporter n=1 Tax=Kocuria sp. PD6 TaxID=2962590 RepID=UPI0013F150B4